MAPPRLQVNVDHVATVRQARRETFPDPVAWALLAEQAGAQGITCHLRRDRRHIQDEDVVRLRKRIATRLNLEASLDPAIVAIARRSGADEFCLVPEDRREVTTEGGLDCVRERRRLARVVPELAERGGAVSLFIDPEPAQIDAAADSGATCIELHTGAYANANARGKRGELARLQAAARHAHERGLHVHAGHGLDYENVGPIASLPHVEELNIGFAIVARALTAGVHAAVADMAELIRKASGVSR